MKKFLLLIIILLLIVFGIGWFALPKMVESGLEGYLAEKVPSEKIEVKMDLQNPLLLLAGTVSHIRADGSRVTLDPLTYDHLTIDLNHVKFNMLKLVTEHRFEPESIGGGTLGATLTAADLQTYLQGRVDNIDNLQVEIDDRQINVTGDVDLAGLLSGTVLVSGEPLLYDNVLQIRPTDLKFNNMGFAGVATNFMKPIKVYDFRDFPWLVTANKVELSNHSVVMTALVR